MIPAVLHTATLKDEALRIGFHDLGIARAEALLSEEPFLHAYLAQSCQGEMHYMEQNLEKRSRVHTLLPDVQSVVVCLLSYFPKKNTPVKRIYHPRISYYAQGKDYHKVLKTSLLKLKDFILNIDPHSHIRCFVDTAPILEKAWAVKAGLGQIGRNSLLQHPQLGSFCFIGILLTTTKLAENEIAQTTTHCSSLASPCLHCHACINACPTQALSLEGSPRLNASRCLAYQTVEHASEANYANLLPASSSLPPLKIFGCDLCQEVCPVNHFSPNSEPSPHADFLPHWTEDQLNKNFWTQIDKTEFDLHFASSPIIRAGLQGIRNNIKLWE